MSPALESTDARNKLEDLSGVEIRPGENPYEALIEACHDDPAEIQALYAAHREARNAQQRAKFLAPDFTEVLVDPFLLRLERPEVEPGFRDPRNCLVFWARPPDHILRLAARLQARLREAAPDLWLMPTHRMHMTTLEIAHSRTEEEIAALVRQMRPQIPALADLPHAPRRRARLVRPMLSYDLAAVALSWVPAAGEAASPDENENANDSSTQDTKTSTAGEGDGAGDAHAYTYHHLRRDAYETARRSGVAVGSRYVVPSAHVTLGRYLTQADHATAAQRAGWVRCLEEANAWLRREVWRREGDEDEDEERETDKDDKDTSSAGNNASSAGAGGRPGRRAAEEEFAGGEWVVGQERGLDARRGRLWYGGGRSIMVGEGF